MPKEISFSIPTFSDIFKKDETDHHGRTAPAVGNAVPSTAGPPGVPGEGQGGTGRSRLFRLLRPSRLDNAPALRNSHASPSGQTGVREAALATSSTRSNGLDNFYSKFSLDRPDTARPLPVITLTGDDLDIEKVIQIARHGARVEIPVEAMQRVQRGFSVVLEAARQGKPVYGLTTGVGQNKDKAVIRQGEAAQTDELRMAQLLEQSRAFNRSSIQAHTSGMGNPLPREQVRAAMLLRLNTLLSGAGGVQPAVVQSLRDFLNHDIVPLIPEHGSIGQGDLLLMGHIGRVMGGEGWVLARHADADMPPSTPEMLRMAGLDPDDPACPQRIVAADQALAEAGLEPLALVGKDFLSIVSTNSLTAGQASLLTHDVAQFLARETVVFALCLEGLNGNVAPFLEVANDEARPFPASSRIASAIREALDGQLPVARRFGRRPRPSNTRSCVLSHNGIWPGRAAAKHDESA
ncbi:MAG: MIO-dependent tyrosine 2,3-aminomutase [Herbaspirillum frisingense]|uniref:MIO-dependent tyrosine 2,3-aminomutase n=1 Tax=Herbaspirillum frisingense TaxID=92645 RepID=A0A7V8FVU1_9BURK|nr:MAG: MIO-dependent tyrosine 2,3-aminomutase [Herbaspirillum frisingense]